METYTSPSGAVYEIRPKTCKYMAGGVLENCEMYEVEETTYDIFQSGNWVQFALTKEGIADSVTQYETPGPDLGSRFD
jgi:hypothetical protein